MGRLEVLITLSGRIKTVDAWAYVPGLLVHKNPNPKRSDYWITHRASGLPIIVEVPGASVPWIKSQLITLPWNLPAEAIYDSDEHRNLVQSIVETMGSLTKSAKQEQRIAEDIGGRVSPASGALPGLKRDGRNLRFLLEEKTTDNAVFRVDIKDIEFLTRQAYIEGKIPGYLVQIKQHEEVALLPEHDVHTLQGYPVAADSTVPVTGKTISITEGLVTEVLSGRVYRFIIQEDPYILINYEAFLDLAKP